jgi:hypothetical protein
MIARFDFRQRGPNYSDFSGQTSESSPALAAGRGRYALLIITGPFVFWLIYRWGMRPDWAAALPSLLAELLGLSEAALAFTLALLWGAWGWREYREMQRITAALPQFSIDELKSLSPTAFEKYVAALFRQQGYRVRRRGGSGDRGVDLELVHGDGRQAIVQCKRYQNSVGPDAVRELYGTLIHERVNHAFLVTTADISVAARAWAQQKPMTLIDGATLAAIVGRLK